MPNVIVPALQEAINDVTLNKHEINRLNLLLQKKIGTPAQRNALIRLLQVRDTVRPLYRKLRNHVTREIENFGLTNPYSTIE